jgi:hypothetical protein
LGADNSIGLRRDLVISAKAVDIAAQCLFLKREVRNQMARSARRAPSMAGYRPLFVRMDQSLLE